MRFCDRSRLSRSGSRHTQGCSVGSIQSISKPVYFRYFIWVQTSQSTEFIYSAAARVTSAIVSQTLCFKKLQTEVFEVDSGFLSSWEAGILRSYFVSYVETKSKLQKTIHRGLVFWNDTPRALSRPCSSTGTLTMGKTWVSVTNETHSDCYYVYQVYAYLMQCTIQILKMTQSLQIDPSGKSQSDRSI